MLLVLSLAVGYSGTKLCCPLLFNDVAGEYPGALGLTWTVVGVAAT